MKRPRDNWRIVGGATKSITLSDFDAYLDAQVDKPGGDVNALYGQVVWAYRCVQLRANAVSAMPYLIENAQETEVDWPIDLRGLLWEIEAGLMLNGAAFWLKQANKVKLKDLRTLNFNSMKVLTDPKAGITGFEQKIGTETTTFMPAQIVYFRYWNPSDDLGPGVAPMQVAMGAAKLAVSALSHANSFFENGALPGILLHTDQTYLNESEAERIESQWNKWTQGLKNTWKAIALTSGLKPEVVTPPLKDLVIPEIEASVRQQIAVAFGIPQTLLEDAANFATAVEHRKSFYTETIIPECGQLETTMNEQLFEGLGLHMAFQPEQLEIMQEDEAARAVSLKSLVDSGLPLRLAMEILGYDLTDEQWAMLEAEAKAKEERAAAMAAALQNAKPPEVNTPGQPGQKQEPGAVEGKPAAGEYDNQAATQAMRMWRGKCAKRGKLAPFESDVIPDNWQAAVKALGANDWESGFRWVERLQALKAKREPDRAAEEVLRKKILARLKAQQDAMVAQIQAGEPVDYDAFGADIQPVLVQELTLFAMDETLAQAASVGIGFDIAVINAEALEWAQQYSYELVKKLTETTRKVVSLAVSEFVATPGMTNEDLVSRLSGAFGEARAQSIAVTEVTRAYAQGTQIAKEQLAENGVDMEKIWNTSADEHVCPICDELDGKPEDEWGDTDSAPAHTKCRCFETLRLRKHANV